MTTDIPAQQTRCAFSGVSDVPARATSRPMSELPAEEPTVLTGTNGPVVAADDLNVVLVKNASLPRPIVLFRAVCRP